MSDERLNDKMEDTKPDVAASAVERLVSLPKRGKDMFCGRNLMVENLDVGDDWTKILENSLPYRKERYDV